MAATLISMWLACPENIKAAHRLIDPVFLNTPVRRSERLNRLFKAELIFKDETANPLRSFKGRGACNLLAQTSGRLPIVCGSAGNFGQGLAWAARTSGIPITVFVAQNAVASKVEAMRMLGATVFLHGHDFDAAKEAAAKYAAATGMLFVEDGSLPELAEGAGTLALELSEQGLELDAFICPLGNGALAAGIGSWMKSNSPSTAVVAVGASEAPAMARSVQHGGVITTNTADTIADGIAVRVPILSAVRAVRSVVDEVMLVDEDKLLSAVRLIWDELSLVVEPAGAIAMAALLATPGRWTGKRIGIPLTGANI